MKKIFYGVFAFCALAFLAVSCEDDNYDSLPPKFSDMTFATLDGGDTFRAGDSIVATLHCSQAGRILVNATHAWSVDDADDVENHFRAGGLYEEMPANPTDTLVLSRPGRYKVVFNGTYTTAGSKGLTAGYTDRFADGNGSVTYDVEGAAIFRYKVTAQKYIDVR